MPEEKVGTAPAYVLDLKPRTPAASSPRIRLWVDKARVLPVQTRLTEPTGDYTTIRFEDVRREPSAAFDGLRAQAARRTWSRSSEPRPCGWPAPSSRRPIWCSWQVTRRCASYCMFCEHRLEAADEELDLAGCARVAEDALGRRARSWSASPAASPSCAPTSPEIVRIVAAHHYPLLTTHGWLVTREKARAVWAGGPRGRDRAPAARARRPARRGVRPAPRRTRARWRRWPPSPPSARAAAARQRQGPRAVGGRPRRPRGAAGDGRRSGRVGHGRARLPPRRRRGRGCPRASST